MGNLGSKYFEADNVPNGVETTLFNFVLDGIANAFYRPTQLKVWSPTGCSRFLIAVYQNGFPQDGQPSDPEMGVCNITTLANLIQMGNGTDLLATVTHFDSNVLHTFKSVLVGQGIG